MGFLLSPDIILAGQDTNLVSSYDGASPADVASTVSSTTPASATPDWSILDYLESAATGQVPADVQSQLVNQQTNSCIAAGGDPTTCGTQAQSDVTQTIATANPPNCAGGITFLNWTQCLGSWISSNWLWIVAGAILIVAFLLYVFGKSGGHLV